MEKEYTISKNILFNFAGQFLLIVISFISTPIIIHYLGIDLFGILAVVIAVLGYFSILDLGMGLSVIKYISEYSAKNDKKSLEKVIGTSLTLYIILGSIGGGLIFLAAQFLASRFLQIPENLIPISIAVFYISAVGFFVNMILTIFNAVPNALQRMDITNTRNVTVGFLNASGTILLLYLGYGLVQIVTLYIFVSLLVTVLLFRDIRKLLPGLNFKPRFDRDIFLILSKFSGYKFIGNIGGQIVFQLDKLILGFFHPISAVTFYTIPSTLIQKAFSLMLNITSAVFPALSQSFTKKDTQRSKQLYLRMGKFIVFIMTPITVLMYIYADLILRMWLGGEFADKSALTLRILSIAYFIASLSAPGVIASDASGKPQLPALFSTISAFVNLVAAFLLIPKYGVEGAALALLINFLSQVPIFIVIVNKTIMKISTLEFVSMAILKPLIAGIVSGFICLSVNNAFFPPIFKLTAGFALFGISYILLNFALGTFDKNDRMTFGFFLSKLNWRKNK